MLLILKRKLIPFNACGTCTSFCDPAPVVYAQLSYFYFCYQIIARLDGESYKWSRVGELNRGRFGHNVFYLNGRFLVVGSTYIFGAKSEKCIYKNNEMVCYSQYPKLLGKYSYTPELMTVTDDYCD